MITSFTQWTEADERRLKFYNQFISPGDIVFDVGANVGNRTKTFLKLNAKVIAIEPQHKCAEFLAAALKGSPDCILVRKALGASEGEADMFISDEPAISSLSLQWIMATKESGRFSKYQWNERQTVQLSTLDKLIASYGCPTFVKIDVEGYEFEVLSGLSQPIDFISIEFTPEYIQSTYKSIDYIISMSNAEFQISVGESMEFELPRWVTAQEAKESLSKLNPRVFGDVYIHCMGNNR